VIAKIRDTRDLEYVRYNGNRVRVGNMSHYAGPALAIFLLGMSPPGLHQRALWQHEQS
jgi:hypothetical protein